MTFAGCGSDDEDKAGPPPRTPSLSVPGENTAPTIPEEPGTGTGTDTAPGTGTETTPGAGGAGGGTPAPGGGGAPAPDSPENDTPPPAGSPEERFEQGCDANPAACD